MNEHDLPSSDAASRVGSVEIDVAAGLTARRSPQYRRLHGLPPETEQETHADWLSRVHPDDRVRAERALYEALSGNGAVYENEYRIIRPIDGEVRWILALGDILRDETGRAVRLVGTHVDITEARRAETSLREMEAMLGQFAEASSEVLWIRDARTLRWEFLSSAFEAVFGLARKAALTGDTLENWADLILPEDRVETLAKLERVRAGERIIINYRIRRATDEEVRWLRETAFPIRDSEGRIVRIGGVGRDTTETFLGMQRLSESEDRLRAAVEVGRLALWDWNVRTGEVSWSDEHFRMEGYGIGSIIPSYEAWAARVHPDDLAAAEAAIAQARETGDDYVHEFRTVHPDGSIHWCSARGRFVYDGAEAVRMIGAMVETTERRESEERQKVLVGELQHRTRNLMAVIQAIADQTARRNDSLEAFVESFRDRLSALGRVQGLLSRFEEGERVWFDELLRAELAAHAALDETGRVSLSGPSDIPLQSGTVQILALALHELATNAVKHGALGQPQGRLDVRWLVEHGHSGRPALLRMEWRESGLAIAPSATPVRGAGLELIERALPYQLQTPTELKFLADGLRCVIHVPLSGLGA
jgi:PAS domain S-box-containing protein